MAVMLRGLPIEDTMSSLIDHSVDVTGAEQVEVIVDRNRGIVHVNVNGICVLRVCRANEIVGIGL